MSSIRGDFSKSDLRSDKEILGERIQNGREVCGGAWHGMQHEFKSQKLGGDDPSGFLFKLAD